jgi:hypothetical protein
LTPNAFSTLGACSLDDPHPKFSPATTISPSFTFLAKSLSIDSKIDLGLKDIMHDDLNVSSKENKIDEPKQEKVSFKKEDKFKVNLDEKRINKIKKIISGFKSDYEK